MAKATKNGNAADPQALPGNNSENSLAVRFSSQNQAIILKSLYVECGSWRAVAEKVGNVSPALCWKVARGRVKSPKIDVALGLQPKTKPVEVCPDCGRVHKQLKTCDHKRPRKTPYRTLAFRFYDRAAFDRARAAVDAGGDRVAWLLAQIQGDDDKEMDDGV